MTRECEKERKGRSRRGSSKAAGIIGTMAIAGGETMREATVQMPATSPGPRLLGAIDVMPAGPRSYPAHR